MEIRDATNNIRQNVTFHLQNHANSIPLKFEIPHINAGTVQNQCEQKVRAIAEEMLKI